MLKIAYVLLPFYLTAFSNQGVFYGIQTLLSMVFTPFAPEGKAVQVNVPSFSIKDAPRYSYRGLHVSIGDVLHVITPDRRQSKTSILSTT